MKFKFILQIYVGLLAIFISRMSASAQTPSLAGVPLDPDKFTTTVAQMINSSGIPQPARIASSLTLKARGADGSDIQINLDRIYQACLGDQAECGEFLNRFVGGARATLLTVITPAQPATLRVVVRPADYLKDPQLGTIMIPVTPPTMPAGLVALLYTDAPTTMRIVNRHDLENLHMSVQQAYDIALRNTMLDLRPFD